MPRFRFALDRVLERRIDDEEARRRALAAIEARRRGLEEALRGRQAEIAAGRSEWREGLVGEVDAEALRHNARAALGLVRRAHRTVLELAALEKPLARARAELVEAARARRALELLRERRLAAHLAEENRREQVELDEFGMRVGLAAAEETRRPDGVGRALRDGVDAAFGRPSSRGMPVQYRMEGQGPPAAGADSGQFASTRLRTGRSASSAGMEPS